jgi:putative transposase
VKLERVAEAGAAARWAKRVNQPTSDAELAAMRKCVARGTPFGADVWARRTAAKLGLESTIRPRGRPRKVRKK